MHQLRRSKPCGAKGIRVGFGAKTGPSSLPRFEKGGLGGKAVQNPMPGIGTSEDLDLGGVALKNKKGPERETLCNCEKGSEQGGGGSGGYRCLPRKKWGRGGKLIQRPGGRMTLPIFEATQVVEKGLR